ncbi:MULTISPECIES: VanW family protein [unclassified Niallia]|uniref:VanW family protein n=1 Tax=Niallia TaxID=2837506 RepID=UPI001EDA1F59|nr:MULTISPECIES: VanW family protein [unclassified Niallia]MCM3032143.1 VanW family protein [Niallia sp. MER 6]UPO89716.1 VanW family protein [Niallia sp. Man26]
MYFSWMLALIMYTQQMTMTDDLIITNKGEEMFVVNRSNFSMQYPVLPFLDTDKLESFMDEIDQQISKKPKNAIIDTNGSIISEQVGYRLNRAVFTDKVYDYFFSNGSAALDIPIRANYPRVDSELLGNIRGEKIGQYITFFNPYNKERNNNINLAAKAINNYVLFPGESFSFNKVVGERTMERGYLPSTAIVNGEYSEQFGGGICQVSSTLFNAVDNAGLNIVQRFTHSRGVSYVPVKRDATVSWDGPDLVFKNDYNQPILILARSINNHIKVDIYSSDVITYTPKQVPYLP